MLSKTLLVAALAALTAAQDVSKVLFFTHVPSSITDGHPQAITYATNDTASPVTILLRKGPSGNLKTVQTLTDKANNGQFIWTPAKSLEDGGDYALEIQQGTQHNYFGPFSVQGQTETSSSSSSMSANHTMTVAPSMSSHVGTVSAGTGTAMHRNTTMSMATLSSMPVTSSMAPTAASSGASFQPSHHSTGNGAIQTDSAIAMVMGAAAAALFL